MKKMNNLRNNFIVFVMIVQIVHSVHGQHPNKYEYSIRSNQKPQFSGTPDLVTIPDDDIPVNDDAGAGGNRKIDRDTDIQIPLDLLNEINDMKNVTEFLDKLIDMDTMSPQDGLFARYQNNEHLERGNSLNPKPAACIPEPTVVPLVPEGASDPSLIYFPSCTRVNRCGGCCAHRLLQCQPTEVETKNFQVVVSQYVGGSKLAYKGKEPVFVEVHTKCKCDCAIKASDCSKYQRYNKSLCQCECTNVTDLDKCLANTDGTKVWDPDNCHCKCREEKDCTTGTAWDGNTCACVEGLTYPKRNTPIQDRSKFILKPIPVGQTDDTRYNLNKK